MIWTAPKMWDGGRCFILGGGPSIPQQFGIPQDIINKVQSGEFSPSAYSPYLQSIHNEHIIGVNNAYQLGQWIDVNFFGDCNWYLVYRNEFAKWPNIKVTCCNRFADRPLKDMEGIKYLAKGGGRGISGSPSSLYGISKNPKKIAWNCNSGAAAINVAVHFGVKQIILLGFDMNHTGDKTHWHRGYGRRPRQSYSRFLNGFPVIAEDAKVMGIEILNASPDSSIDVFPKVLIKDLL
jgi:hypothetical protein